MLFDKMKCDIHRWTWQATKDFGVAATTLTINFPVWGTDYVTGIHGRIVTAFAGIAGPVTMEIGSSSDTSSIMLKRDLSITGQLWTRLPEELWFCDPARRSSKYDLTAPIITFTSGSGNLEDLTAGQIEIVVAHLVPDR